jgi:hypothetical protein
MLKFPSIPRNSEICAATSWKTRLSIVSWSARLLAIDSVTAHISIKQSIEWDIMEQKDKRSMGT